MMRRFAAQKGESVYIPKLGLQSMKTVGSSSPEARLMSLTRSLTQVCTKRHASEGPGLVAARTREACTSSCSSPVRRWTLGGACGFLECTTVM